MEDISFEVLSWENVLVNNKKIRYELKSIDNHFKTILKYKNSFEGLYFEELRNQIDRMLEGNVSREKILQGKFLLKKFQKKKFILMIQLFDELRNELQEKNLVLVVFDKSEQKISKSKKIFGIVAEKTNKKKVLLIETNFSNWKDFNRDVEFLQIIIIKQASKLMELVKEVKVLSSLKNASSDLKSAILLPQKRNFKLKKNEIIFPNINHLLIHFNKSQIKAIVSFFKNDITLIQGPPGTGKTKTILGIVSIINIIQKNSIEYYPDYHTIPEKIIVCAPSNAAIDENVFRATEGLISITKSDKKWVLNMVRLGPNYNSSLDHLSLENLAIIAASDKDHNMRLGIFSEIFKKKKKKILKRAFAIFTTLACTGYSIMKIRKKTETIILDEAGQAIELSTLIPIREFCKKLILIGDVNQLPATTFSKFSSDFGYNRSLFKRLQMDNFRVKFLKNQYRMHPQISSFPARKFYRNFLRDSFSVKKIKNFQKLRCFGPLIFFDICDGNEQSHLAKSSSLCNLDELRALSFVLRSLLCLHPTINLDSIGVIGGYLGQIEETKDYKLIKNIGEEIQINTIDGFQGKEKEIICFTCVRAKEETGIGFLSDCRRVNVSFTRAKNGFWIFGNAFLLTQDKNWSETIKDVKKRTRYINVRKPLERANRKILYWSVSDNQDYSYDGQLTLSTHKKLLDYLKFLQFH